MRSRTGLWNDGVTIRREDGSVFAVCDSHSKALALVGCIDALIEIRDGCATRGPNDPLFRTLRTKAQILGITRGALENLYGRQPSLPLEAEEITEDERDLVRRAQRAGL